MTIPSSRLHRVLLAAGSLLAIAFALAFFSGFRSSAPPLLAGAAICLALAAGTARGRWRDMAFTVWIIAGVALGMTFHSSLIAFPDWFFGLGGTKLTVLIIPLLQLIMFAMGTTLSVADFARVLKMPGGVLIGLACQFTVMPLLGFTLAHSVGLPPAIAAGLILVGVSPSGLASNVMSFIAKADVAMSVTMTALATLISPVLTPVLMKVLAGEMVAINVPVMMWDMTQIVLLPVVSGLAFHHFVFHRWKSLERLMPPLSMAGIFVITVVTVAPGRDKILEVGPLLVLACFLHCTAGFALGYGVCRLLRLDPVTCRTIAIEVGMQNSGLAAGLATKLGKVATLGLAPIVFGPIMNVTASILANWWRAHPPPAPDPTRPPCHCRRILPPPPHAPPAPTFHIGLTGDFFRDGSPVYPDFDLRVFERSPGIACSTFPEHTDEITPQQLAGLHGVIVLSPRVTRHSLSQSRDLLAISRFGVGYDSVDVAACTENDVALCITTGAVDRPMAEATVGWMLALAYRMRVKDRQLREARWDQRGRVMGTGLHGRTAGIIGFGGIGRSVAGMLSGFGMNPPLVYDPGVDPETIAALGARSVNLPYLMARSDFITVHCPLNAQTENLISVAELDLMKTDAFILNTARGGIINEDALFEVLAAGRIAGAALDCFTGEPITHPHRFASLDNVILAPHNIGWTRELFRDIGAMACRNLIDLANGRYPGAVVNPEVFDRASFQKKWESLRIDKRPPQE